MKTAYSDTACEKTSPAWIAPPVWLGRDWVKYFDVSVADSWGQEVSSGTVASGREWSAGLHGAQLKVFGAETASRTYHFLRCLEHRVFTGAAQDSWLTFSESPTQPQEFTRDLRVGHTLRDERAVLLFLSEHSELLPVLLDGRHHVSQLFGVDAHVELDVVFDPESSGYRQLFAYIVTSMSTAEVIEGLRRFDKEWFLGQSKVVGDLLCYSPVIR